MRHPLSKAPRNAIPYLALLVVAAIGLGGGYALAASSNKTIKVCADKKTGILHLKTRGKCSRSQTRVTWNQRGPAGPQGSQGATGPQGVQGVQGMQGPGGAQGPAAPNVWALVAGNGAVLAGQGLSVDRTQAGTYQVTVTDPTCSQELNAPVVTLSDSNPPSEGANTFPEAWYEAGGGTNEQFTVFTGFVMAGSFTASDHTFDVIDACSDG
jgi:hypothetical protein